METKILFRKKKKKRDKVGTHSIFSYLFVCFVLSRSRVWEELRTTTRHEGVKWSCVQRRIHKCSSGGNHGGGSRSTTSISGGNEIQRLNGATGRGVSGGDVTTIGAVVIENPSEKMASNVNGGLVCEFLVGFVHGANPHAAKLGGRAN